MGPPQLLGNTLVISPHSDDACFSIGGLLLKKRSGKVTILTVFSKSRSSTNSILLRSFSKASKVLNVNLLRRIAVEVVSRVRQKEDTRFCDRVDAVQCLLPFADSELRGSTKTFLASKAEAEQDSVYNDVCKAIRNILVSGSYDRVLVPLAIGNHVDHMIVLEAFLQVFRMNRSISAEVFLYEDLPYASSYKMDFINSVALNRTGSNSPLVVNITVEMPTKQNLAGKYHSQSNGDELERISFHARRLFKLANEKVDAEGYSERFWRLSAS